MAGFNKAELYVRDTQGSLIAVRANLEGALLSALDVSDITVDTDLDSLNGTTIATGSGVSGAGTLRVVQVVNAVNSVNVVTVADQTPALNSGVAGAGTMRTVHVTDVIQSVNVNTWGGTDLGGSATYAGATGDGSGQQNGPVVHALNWNFNGGSWDRFRGDTGGGFIQGGIVADDVDAGRPIKIGGQARTTNPTAVANADRVNAMFDDVGRPVSWLYQVRDLVTTASTTLVNGTSGIFASAGGAGVFLDLMSISFANTSAGAVRVDLLSDSSIERTYQVPANDTTDVEFTYPLLQGAANTEWQLDMDDVSNTTVEVKAHFIRNV